MRRIQKSEYQALAEFRYALRHFLRFSAKAAESIGLTPKQHQALLAIQGFPGRERITISELAERLQIRHHSAVGLVDRLCAQGLLLRKRSTQDRRQVFIGLTAKGAKDLEKLSTAHKEELKRIEPQLRRLMENLSSHDVS
ncbi:MAG: MarR family winged helix-turn-helix transcriptional regulator [Anaerolineales bacterium]